MPNWCYTNYRFRFGNHDAAERFEKLLNDWTSHDYSKNGFGKCWLGNILGNSGTDILREDGNFSYRARGQMIHLARDERNVYVQTETAWEPMHLMWLAVIEKHFSDEDVEVVYDCSEEGMELFLTNNPDLGDRFIIEGCDIDSEWELTRSELNERAADCLGKPFIELETLSEDGLLRLLNEDSNISAYKWEWAPIEDAVV